MQTSAITFPSITGNSYSHTHYPVISKKNLLCGGSSMKSRGTVIGTATHVLTVVSRTAAL